MILLPLAVSAFALLLAFVSLVVAAQAVSEANDAKAAAAGARPTADGTVQEQTPAPEQNRGEQPPPIDPTATGAPPELDERTNYDVEYEKESLTLAANSDQSMYVDLDEPRANAPREDHDIALVTDYSSASNRFLQLGADVMGTTAGEAGMTPHDCYDKIRTAPLLPEAKVPARQGLVMCVLTSFAAAQTRGDEWRLVRLEVTGVGADNAVTVQLTAWNIPR